MGDEALPLAKRTLAGQDAPLLELRDLKVHFAARRQAANWWRRETVRAVDGVSLAMTAGETLGLVGESGCGKSTTARAIVGLVRPTSGQVWLEGNRVDQLASRTFRPLRRQVQMVFQDPFASLNPRMTVGQIIAEPMKIFRLYSRRDRPLETMRLMELVGLKPRQMNRYPHEFSGGQRQRIGIARALAVDPQLIVCDEAVSALDVSIQAQVVNLLMDLQQRLGLAYLFIAHDLSVVRHIANRVGVMYLGRLVELASAEELFQSPRHPYTQALLSAVPIPDPAAERRRRRMLLTGDVPLAIGPTTGCAFAPRCPLVEPRCRVQAPRLTGSEHQTACLLTEASEKARADSASSP